MTKRKLQAEALSLSTRHEAKQAQQSNSYDKPDHGRVSCLFMQSVSKAMFNCAFNIHNDK